MKYCFLRYPEGRFKAVTLSYDDGNCCDLKLIEILNRYGMKATFNVCSKFIGEEGRLSLSEIKRYILDCGHEVAVHGENHIAPGVGKPEFVISDILNCRNTLEKNLNSIIRGMAYPDSGIMRMHNGNKAEEIKCYIKQLGIVYARTWGKDNSEFTLPNDFLEWIPTSHHENPELNNWVEKFLNLEEGQTTSFLRYPRLFYLWGHSCEFEQNKNWDIIEKFCSSISGRDDIWYATNIEIYEYVKAYESLVMSADGSKIYNPTLKKIWIDVDGVQHSLNPGETIYIFFDKGDK